MCKFIILIVFQFIGYKEIHFSNMIMRFFLHFSNAIHRKKKHFSNMGITITESDKRVLYMHKP